MRAALRAAALGLGVAACGSKDQVLIPGTTTRVSAVVPEENDTDKGLELSIFRTPDDCTGARIPDEERHLCLPSIDRASGEVRLSYQLVESDANVYDLPPHQGNLRVFHNGAAVESESILLVPHMPSAGAGQLYMLVIDGSGSMAETDRSGRNRMDLIRGALLQDDVVDAFFPEGGQNAVVILQFTGGQPVPVGGELKLLKDKKSFRRTVKGLAILNGYTHLYDAVQYATGPLLKEDVVLSALEGGLSPTVVALTDGFNNIAAQDTCADNAPRLSRLLKHIKGVREGSEADLRRRPTVHAVGLGAKLRRNFQIPETVAADAAVDPKMLCSERYMNERIDGGLERSGIDNASLELIAHVGGGLGMITRGQNGLGEAFRRTAQLRYQWFELRYRTDPFHLRREFRVRLQLNGYARAGARVGLHPSGWFDAPPAQRGPDAWHTRTDMRHTLGVVMPMLGVLISLSYVGAAFFNIRRALTRLRRPKGRPAQVVEAAPPG